MDTRIKEKIRDIIKQNCSWLEPIDDNLPSTGVSKCANFTIHITIPALALRVKRRRKGFFRNRIIRISECMLDDAIAKMSSDPGFLKRQSKVEITIQDVETLVSVATCGTLKLDLYDF